MYAVCRKAECKCKEDMERLDVGWGNGRLLHTCRCFGLLSSGFNFHDAVTGSASLSLLLRTAALGILQCTTLFATGGS